MTGRSSGLITPTRARTMRDMEPSQSSASICRNCQHWTRHDDARMAYYGECAQYFHRGYYTVEQSRCMHEPAKFEARS